MAPSKTPTSLQFRALRLSIDNHFARYPRQTLESRAKLSSLAPAVLNIPRPPGCPLYLASNASSPSLVTPPSASSPSPVREPTYAPSRSDSLPLLTPHVLDETYAAVNGADFEAGRAGSSDLCYNGQAYTLDALNLHGSNVGSLRHTHRRSSVVRMQEAYAVHLSLKEFGQSSKFGARALAKARRALAPRKSSDSSDGRASQSERRGSAQSDRRRTSSISTLSLGSILQKVKIRTNSVDGGRRNSILANAVIAAQSPQEEAYKNCVFADRTDRRASTASSLDGGLAVQKRSKTKSTASDGLSVIHSDGLSREISHVTVIRVKSRESGQRLQRSLSQRQTGQVKKTRTRARAATTSDNQSASFKDEVAPSGRARGFSIRNCKTKLNVFGQKVLHG